MSKENPGKAEVLIIHHPPKIKHGCKHCGKIHLSGEYAVGLEIFEDGKKFRYAIGFDVAIWCCGEEKPFFQVFDDKGEAELLCAEVTKHLNEQGTTVGLKMIGFHPSAN